MAGRRRGRSVSSSATNRSAGSRRRRRVPAFRRGDLVVGIVRRPDPVPCPACAAGEWDMCRNGQYTERGIKQRNGYGSEQFRVEHDFAIKLDPALDKLGVLLEPTSVVAKAWEQVERIGARGAAWQPRVALITGAGPVGLLAALIGTQRGFDVTFSTAPTTAPSPSSCAISAPPTTPAISASSSRIS